MSDLLIKLMLTAALAQLGLSISDVECRGRSCAQRVERISREVLHVDWRPISVFPEEGRRFW